MSLNYTQLVAALQNLLQEEDAGNTQAFTDIIPQIIADAENRIYRELVFLGTRETNISLSFASGSRSLDMSSISPPIVTVEQVAANVAGTLVYYMGPTSLDLINFFWPRVAMTKTPGTIQGYWGMQDDHTIVVSPTPDAIYVANITGIFRPLPMSSTNQNTYLGTNYPDLFLSACMVFSTAWQRDWGAASDDPKMAMSWESHYQTEKMSVMEEEARRRGESTGWTPNKNYGIAQPPRT